jgi:methyltransferase (TIGR00027 family)
VKDKGPVVQHISDTARWAAVYRAAESERPDALFQDPFARRLAGTHGEEIAAALPFHDQNSWAWVARTYLIDRFLEQLVERTDLIVNLGAGLDTRPYRLKLPADLRWVEVDLAGILDYKEQALQGEEPVCSLDRVRLDLTEIAARRAFLDTLDRKWKHGLVISEGVIIYLSPEEASALAEDLACHRSIQHWIVDIASPGLLQMVQKNTNPQLGQGVSPLRFAPADGPQFFARHGRL